MSRLYQRRLWAATAASAIVLVGLAAPPAAADTAPTTAGLPATVSSDPLPTVQINGVVWNQLIVGNTVYVGGEFTSARPAGSPAGTNEVPRSNLLAYDLTTGALITSFAPVVNAQVKDLAVSPDGRTLYVSGSFTSIDSQTRYRVAAFDVATGALTSWRPVVNSRVDAIDATATTVAIGGIFTTVGGVTRNRVATVSASTGAPLAFDAAVDDHGVLGLAIAPDEASVVIAGNFTSVAGSNDPGYGLARLDMTTGASLALPVNSVIRDAGDNSAILSLEADENGFYGTGYHFGRAGNSEGVFSASWATGELTWLEDCHGDTYSAYPVGDVVYAASHKHYCGNSGGFPQTTPWTYHRATAMTNAAMRVNTADYLGYPDHPGTPSPTILSWWPDINAGTYTGKTQGPWTVTGNADYVLYGGEFTEVNGVGQQGLVRFARTDLAPNDDGPRLTSSAFTLKATSSATGEVHLTWTANWDRDNETLTYRLYRSSTASTPLTLRSVTARFWQLPILGYTDKGLSPGSSQRYRVTATDAFGNVAMSDWVTVTVAGSGTTSPYLAQVRADEPYAFWRLGETSGTTLDDTIGWDDQTKLSGVTLGATGGIAGDTDGAATFSGSSSNGYTYGTVADNGPRTFSVEAWINTTTTTGGKIVGFGTRQTGTSTVGDRHLYLDNSGRVNFGTQSLTLDTVRSTQAVNDGKWHHLVGTYTDGVLKLYVDGALAASRSDVSMIRELWGWWRIGGDRLNGWPNRPSSDYFKGTIDDVAVYRSVLSAAQIQQHWLLGSTGVGSNVAPTADFTATPGVLSVSVDGSASVDTDGTIASYAWQFGDGGTATGATASHTYAAAGTYTVTLTVTDDDGATGTLSKVVDVPGVPNVAPTAAFTTSVADLTVDVDGSGSTDSDGVVTAYAWDFGDGGSATGATASHTYAAAGTYTVTLAVTDDDGAVGTSAQQVTVTAPEPGTALASDSFGRTVSGGWGTAPVGGAWTTTGTASRFSVDGQVGVQSLVAGTTLTSSLDAVSSDSTEVRAVLSASSVPTGTGAWVHVQARRVSATNWYGARVRLQPDGSVQLHLTRGNGTAVSGIVVPGLSFAAGDQLNVRVQADGTSPTTVRAKVWKVGSTEPDAWQVETTDTTAGLQTTGGIGFQSYLTSSAASPVSITVDDLWAGAVGTSPVVVNQAPVAAFSATPAGLSVAVDGSASSDDGTVVSYAWDFGDGGSATGATASHDYAVGGTYSVTLTVTDDQGLTGQLSQDVTVSEPGVNQAPVAAFSATPAGLSVAVDGSASSDDGTVVSYAWDFGDGGSATGATASHDYAAGGTYSVTLTVTDDQGVTGQLSQDVTVTEPPAAGVIAADAFARTVSGGWGTADTGGDWALTGTASRFAVDGTAGTMTLVPGLTLATALGSVSATSTDTVVTIAPSVIPNGSGAWVHVQGRRVSATEYYGARLRLNADGTVQLHVTRGNGTVVAGGTVPGLTLAAGDQVRVRVEVSGTNPTTVQARAWKVGTDEPTTWFATATDTTAALQVPGGVGLIGYLTSSATNGPLVLAYDDLEVLDLN
ncbi:PKD domain-containing protein [Actinotalea sp. M2MS4P-6]|uniref:PKD domain-containing protein n=1 Tax=Actinotalea sp. M2MS4P-6 TaxID=2983762 RepID=UPI0021E3B210|nr:PKD domain-containing protein [Actinotalea sp. M2MS4P-6]MCV2395823.1 PKD domain-containing protein [Actinotalea sp. M2MS4P-6]